MNRTSLSPAYLVCGTVLGTAALISLAGPLDPPAGPVTGTYKTLSEVEPRTAIGANTPGDADSLFKITQPGSYYLMGNIAGVAGKHGIEIAASSVTLDLNGFGLVGVAGMGAFDGVSVSVDSLRGIAVINGSVRNWGDGGVDLGFLSRGCRVEGVLASGNAGTGITSSIASTVTNCTSTFNGQRGIRASNSSTITQCSVESNAGNGIEVNHGCTISKCSAYFNTGNGVLTGLSCAVSDCSAFQGFSDGIRVGEGSNVSGCSALNNAATGIRAGDRCMISCSTAGFNDADGIGAGVGCTIQNCSASDSALNGIAVAEGGTVLNCTARGNDDDGINAGVGSSVTGSTTQLNGNNGISVNLGSTVSGCSATSNAIHGIEASGSCIIRANTCNLNGRAGVGAGINVYATDTRIEGNNCISADYGIRTELGGNIIIGNTCSTNTVANWALSIGSFYGPIIDRTGVNTPAVLGAAAAGTLNTSDPHANFSY